jgi:hypothetical protein
MPADIFFTHHAVERFVQRHAPESSQADAAAHLARVDATRLRERTILGQLQYQVENPRCVLVVKRDPNCSPDLVCVTVLPERENARGWSEDELAIRNEWLADQAERKVARDVAHATLLTEDSARGHKPTPVPAPASPQSKPQPSPVPPRITLPRDPEQARIVAELQTLALTTSIEREREKTKRHEMTEFHNNVLLKRCLRIVLADLVSRAARGDAAALQISELVQQVRPEFLTGDFLRVEEEGSGE